MPDDFADHITKLDAMAEAVARKLTQALYAGGRRIEQHAELSITKDSVSGKFHVPSAPGEPPNRDTGGLDSNIETRIVADGPAPEVHVESKAEYAAALEFGTRKMKARPYMRPAAKAKSAEVGKLVGAAVQAEIRRMSGG